MKVYHNDIIAYRSISRFRKPAFLAALTALAFFSRPDRISHLPTAIFGTPGSTKSTSAYKLEAFYTYINEKTWVVNSSIPVVGIYLLSKNVNGITIYALYLARETVISCSPFCCIGGKKKEDNARARRWGEEVL